MNDDNKQQKSLFDTEPAPWELDQKDDWLVARVAFSEAPFGPYDYLVPNKLRENLKKGMRVHVPLGRNRAMKGYCVDLINSTRRTELDVAVSKMKDVLRIADEQRLIDERMLELAKWIGEYYICPLGVALETVVPGGVRTKAGTRESLYLSVPIHVAAKATQLKLPKVQAKIIWTLMNSLEPLTIQQLAEKVGCTQGPITTLRKRNLIHAESRREHQNNHDLDTLRKLPNLKLNEQQQFALDSILTATENNDSTPIVLHGITGSGKTEVYIQAIERVIQYGRQAIVLVPEISLTPQTRQRFRERFENVAVLHSHLSDSERHWHWKQIAAGKIQVIVGARSAIFAPAPHLGIVVIDEEHDNSFKQDRSPRYHARAVAEKRCQMLKIPLILGSATPALETWQKAISKKYHLLPIPNRVSDRPLPDVSVIDLRGEFKDRHSRGAISRKMHTAISESVEAGGQAILLLNRRGFATSIQCPACGHVVECPNCDMPLTHHRDDQKAICHYCDHTVVAPDRCIECDYVGIRFAGLGTQKLEEEVKKRFPDYECLRMDSDSMQRPGSHEKALASFRRGEFQILLGTQMIAKGLDFPNVTLVGVINADSALHFPDFRAAERTFGLVTQVAGRTGRGEKGGRVIVQAYSPEHFAVQAATEHDYIKFATEELPNREEFQYPPFAALARIVVRGESQEATEMFVDHIADTLENRFESEKCSARILGPAPAPMAKLRGMYRFHLLIQYKKDGPAHGILTSLQQKLKTPNNVQWIIDIDPLDML